MVHNSNSETTWSNVSSEDREHPFFDSCLPLTTIGSRITLGVIENLDLPMRAVIKSVAARFQVLTDSDIIYPGNVPALYSAISDCMHCILFDTKSMCMLGIWSSPSRLLFKSVRTNPTGHSNHRCDGGVTSFETISIFITQFDLPRIFLLLITDSFMWCMGNAVL